MMSIEAAALFLLALIGPCAYAAWSDLNRMTIPNGVVLICLAIFVALGPFLLPVNDYLWRFVPALVVLAAGFLLNLTGQFGAGDAKFAAALVLFVDPVDHFTVLWIYALLALVSVALVFAVKRLAPRFAEASGYKSLQDRRTFPLGLPLALTILVYLALVIRHQWLIGG
ncbi:MAG: hypothetical protein D6754_03390 [Alphaproteobacteria bacterium]|nr:MAG: hypothetical protein D6754_03390 [Alphaproteobacteria bacterium]